jgi:hypothetical protein
VSVKGRSDETLAVRPARGPGSEGSLRLRLCLAVLGLSVALVAGCGPTTHTINGVATINAVATSSGCDLANSSYADVQGANVLVMDASGTTIGTAPLQYWPDAPSSYQQGHGNAGQWFPCVFRWTATVPETAFYHAKLAQRDGPTVSLADMNSQGWKWELKLGG